MSSIQNTQAFIVRIWREPREFEGAPIIWRGVVIHVSSGEERYIKELDEIITFIAPYLEQIGVELKPPGRLRQWLSRRR
jgi:hypothetical protein